MCVVVDVICIYVESIHRFSGAETELVHFQIEKKRTNERVNEQNQTTAECICDDNANEGGSWDGQISCDMELLALTAIRDYVPRINKSELLLSRQFHSFLVRAYFFLSMSRR